MKRLIPILVLLISMSAFAQRDGKMSERIKAQKIAFITERLDLTETEAQKFWPIYNAFEAKNQKLRQLFGGRDGKGKIDGLSEQEAKSFLDEMMTADTDKHQLKQQFVKDLLKVLPAKKIILLKATEDAFNRRMMEQFKKRRESFRKNNP